MTKVPLKAIQSRHAGFAAGLQQLDTQIAQLEAELVKLRADRRATAGAVQALAQLIEDVAPKALSSAPTLPRSPASTVPSPPLPTSVTPSPPSTQSALRTPKSAIA